MPPRKIASAQEIDRFFTAVMRAEPDAEGTIPKLTERMKAAELLAKRRGLTDAPSSQEAFPTPQTLADIQQTLRLLARGSAPGDPAKGTSPFGIPS